MDWQLTCRVCLDNGDMVSLFDWDENNEMLGEKYAYCCGVKIPKCDSLPTLICLNCVDRLTLAYQFKKQCLSSNDTLKDCLDEYLKSSAAVSSGNKAAPKSTETETITIKQENGVLLQYELPIEHEPPLQWKLQTSAGGSTVISAAPEPKKRGRPRKYPNELGQIAVSPYKRKKPKATQPEEQALTTLLASGVDLKEEPVDDAEEYEGIGDFDGDDDPDFFPGDDDNYANDPDDEIDSEDDKKPEQAPRKRGRPRKNPLTPLKKPKKEEDTGEDMLLQETIMAISEPIPDHILNPKPKEKRKYTFRKKYVYEKSHICETCGASFTSNSSLQAHIRRHLGIKPFVCSVCGYACVLNEALKRHMLRHTGEKPYKCRICDRRFGDYGTRQKHERLHLGVRPYQCSLCGKSFTYSYVLANHMLTHTGEKKFACTPCNKKFTKAHHLKYHNKVHHKEIYIQQQLEMEAKKMRQQINVSGLLTAQMTDGGNLQIIHTTDPDSMGMVMLQEEQVEHTEQEEEHLEMDEEKETDRAVAEMQAVVYDNDDDYCIQDDDDDEAKEEEEE